MVIIEKICKKCRILQPITDYAFYTISNKYIPKNKPRQEPKKARRHTCKTCIAKNFQEKYVIKNREKFVKNSRKYRIKIKKEDSDIFYKQRLARAGLFYMKDMTKDIIDLKRKIYGIRKEIEQNI